MEGAAVVAAVAAAVCTDCKVGNAVAINIAYVGNGDTEMIIIAQVGILGSRAIYLLSVFDGAVRIHE